MFCALVQWLCYAQLKLKSKKYGRRRNQRRKPKQKEISKSNTQKSQYSATMPLYDSRSIAEINRRLTTFQSPVGLFELEFCSTGASVSFSSSLAGFAALCKLRYGPPSTLSPRRAMAPRFSLPLKRTLEVHASCGAHASGLGAESMGTANTRREKSLLMNRMTYARKQISRNGKGNRTF